MGEVLEISDLSKMIWLNLFRGWKNVLNLFVGLCGQHLNFIFDSLIVFRRSVHYMLFDFSCEELKCFKTLSFCQITLSISLYLSLSLSCYNSSSVPGCFFTFIILRSPLQSLFLRDCGNHCQHDGCILEPYWLIEI